MHFANSGELPALLFHWIRNQILIFMKPVKTAWTGAIAEASSLLLKAGTKTSAEGADNRYAGSSIYL